MLLVLGFLATPAVEANPYSDIGDRNIFGLKDPPVDTPPPVEEEPEILPGVRITGITTLMGVERALVKLSTPANPKTKTPAEEASYILVAGGPAQGGVQVLEIQDHPDPKEVKVKVRQGGKESWLNLEKDTVRVAAAPKPAPGAKPMPAATAQKLAMQRAAATRARAGGVPQPATAGALPNRSVRTAQGGVPGTPGYAPGAHGATVQAGTKRANSRHIIHDNQGLSREEQIIIIEANRLNTIEDVAAGVMPPLPPTELTPPELDPTIQPTPNPLDQLLPP